MYGAPQFQKVQADPFSAALKCTEQLLHISHMAAPVPPPHTPAGPFPLVLLVGDGCRCREHRAVPQRQVDPQEQVDEQQEAHQAQPGAGDLQGGGGDEGAGRRGRHVPLMRMGLRMTRPSAGHVLRHSRPQALGPPYLRERHAVVQVHAGLAHSRGGASRTKGSAVSGRYSIHRDAARQHVAHAGPRQQTQALSPLPSEEGAPASVS